MALRAITVELSSVVSHRKQLSSFAECLRLPDPSTDTRYKVNYLLYVKREEFTALFVKDWPMGSTHWLFCSTREQPENSYAEHYSVSSVT